MKSSHIIGDRTLFRWCPTTWPPKFGCHLAAGALVRIRHIELEGANQFAFVESERSDAFSLHKVHLNELHKPETTKPLINPGCAACKQSCPLRARSLHRFHAKLLPPSVKRGVLTPAVSAYMAELGRRGGSKVTAAKLAGLEKARAARAEHVKRRHEARAKLGEKKV